MLGFEQCGELTHTMTMRFYRGEPATRTTTSRWSQVEDPSSRRPMPDWSMDAAARSASTTSPSATPTASRGSTQTPPPQGERRRVHRPRQPRHDALGVHRRPRRLRPRGRSTTSPSEVWAGRRRRGAQLLRVPGAGRGARRPHRLPALRTTTPAPRSRCRGAFVDAIHRASERAERWRAPAPARSS